MSEVHPAPAYQRGRPAYPAAMHDWLVGILRLRSGGTALDLGAGTGKFSAVLLATGARVLAADPVRPMLIELHRRTPAVAAIVASAQRLPLRSESVETVTCAQSFHWFAGTASLREIHRVLKRLAYLPRWVAVRAAGGDLLCSRARRPPEQVIVERVATQVRALIATHPLLAGRDRIAFPYQTRAYACLRLG